MNNLMMDDDGIIIWTENNLPSDNLQMVDIHYNLWSLYKQNAAFIDVGIRFFPPIVSNKIYISIPWRLNRDSVQDLSYLLQNKDISVALFNDSCTVESKDSFFILSYNHHQMQIVPSMSNMQQVNKNYGCVLSSSIPECIDKNKELYLRFRIPNPSLSNLVKKDMSYSSSIISPTVRTEHIYTIRTNNVRSLPQELSKTAGQKLPKISKIITTIGIDSHSRLSVDYSSCMKIRTLEKVLCEEYAPKGFRSNNTVIFQWKNERKDGKNYTLSLLFAKERLNCLSMLIYCSFIVLLNIFSSFLCNFLSTFIT